MCVCICVRVHVRVCAMSLFAVFTHTVHYTMFSCEKLQAHSVTCKYCFLTVPFPSICQGGYDDELQPPH